MKKHNQQGSYGSPPFRKEEKMEKKLLELIKKWEKAQKDCEESARRLKTESFCAIQLGKAEGFKRAARDLKKLFE